MQLFEAFLDFHEANPIVYVLFKKFAREARLAGRKKYSAQAILNRIRWYTNVETKSTDDYKINDHHSAYYARLFVLDHPEYADFFWLRDARAHEQIKQWWENNKAAEQAIA